VDQDHVVETQTLDTINNVTLHAFVGQHTLVKRRINKIPIVLFHLVVKPLMIVMEVLTIVYTHPMGHLTVVPVSLGNKRVDHAVVIWDRSIKNNVIPLVNVDILMGIAHCQEPVI
jgi:hypothetical protein